MQNKRHTSYKMKTVSYTGDVWQGPTLHPDLNKLLLSKDLLIELTHGPPDYQIVIGVPHQADANVDQIAEMWWDARRQQYGRTSDGAIAPLALALFTNLQTAAIACRLIIAAHATDHDPNKVLDSPYCQCIFARPARLLLECHGASVNHRHDLEVSAGSNGLSHPCHFGRLLAQALDWHYRVAAQVRPHVNEAKVFVDARTEKSGKLRLPALHTPSLRHAATYHMHALHLEAKPRFRLNQSQPNTLTKAGQTLARALAGTVSAYLDIL